MASNLKKLVIDRARWDRGCPQASKLLRMDNGKMCCLGFLAKDCGYTDEEILSISDPSWVKDTSKFPKYMFGSEGKHLVTKKVNSNLGLQMMHINDDEYMGDAFREESLIPLFRQIGYELTFVDE